MADPAPTGTAAGDLAGGGTPAGGNQQQQFNNPANQPGGGNAADPKPAAWHAGQVDAETLGHWQNKGWDASDPVRLAIAATKAHRDAEAYTGVPADRLVKLPVQGDTAGMRSVWERLGAPKDAAGYDLASVKFKDGSDVGPEFDTSMRASFHRLGINKEAAVELTKDFVAFMENAEVADQTANQGRIAAQISELQRNWGPNFEANRFVAKQAAKALGVDGEVLDALEKQIGYSKVMEMFRSIGSKIGEDRFVTSGGGGNSNIMTREQAVARRGELMRDPVWAKAYTGGGTKENAEMRALLIQIHGDDTNESRGF